MKILITTTSRLPAEKYGGTERVIWCLAKELSELGHQVVFLAAPDSDCSFADVISYTEHDDLRRLIPEDVDVVHFNSDVPDDIQFPYVVTQHGNCPKDSILDRQTIFVSSNHAKRYGSTTYVHNGLDWKNDSLDKCKRSDFHFLGKAAWRRKNVKGAISTTMRLDKAKLNVLGGSRLNFSMGFRFTMNPRVKFHGMVNDKYKYAVMQRSKGLVFPVRWNEPFGLALIESLYCGCPVFGTPYGALPEIVPNEVGFLSNKSDELSEALKNAASWSSISCREYAVEQFNAKKMAYEYLKYYEKAINGSFLNEISPKATDDPNAILPWFH
ncbi:MAG: glycosyl transferase [Opitutae bacterium]|nr:glycosyl transferase [Opitutae bacterium]|tara:strand:+ start:6207 stop:7184 length:978 start_codon:yes stop_codon:yes gene_type:complete